MHRSTRATWKQFSLAKGWWLTPKSGLVLWKRSKTGRQAGNWKHVKVCCSNTLLSSCVPSVSLWFKCQYDMHNSSTSKGGHHYILSIQSSSGICKECRLFSSSFLPCVTFSFSMYRPRSAPDSDPQYAIIQSYPKTWRSCGHSGHGHGQDRLTVSSHQLANQGICSYIQRARECLLRHWYFSAVVMPVICLVDIIQTSMCQTVDCGWRVHVYSCYYLPNALYVIMWLYR